MGSGAWRTERVELHPHQYEFFEAEESKVALVTGLGGGKTWIGSLWALLKGLRNPGVKGLIFANSYKQLKGATLEKLFEHLELLDLEWRFNRQDMILVIERRVPVYLRSMENFNDVRGIEFGWAYGDEVRDLNVDAHNVVVGRLRDKRCDALQLRYTTTPAGLNWIYDEFIEKPEEARAYIHRGLDVPVKLRPYLRYKVIQARSTDNPDLPEEYLEALSTYDPELAKQEVGGEFVDVGRGRAYYNFDRRRNVSEAAKYVPELPIALSFDFNASAPAPMAAVMGHERGREGWVFDEIAIPGGTTPEVCDVFLAKYGKHKGGVKIYGDAMGNHPSTQTGDSDYKIVKEKLGSMPGFAIRITKKSNPAVVDRLNAQNAVFFNVKKEVRYLVHPRCSWLIADFVRVKTKPGTRKIDKSADPKRTHHSDASGYWVAQRWPLLLSNLVGSTSNATTAEAMAVVSQAERGGIRASRERQGFGTGRGRIVVGASRRR